MRVNLNIPKNCKIDRPLFKKQFLENFSLTSQEKKLFSSEVESITLNYLLNKENINITPFIDEDRDYSEIAFINVELSSPTKMKQLSIIIQHIPYPLIVFFSHEDSICINISPKRINRADSSKLVVEDEHFTEWIDLENQTDIEKSFFESLRIENHPFTDLLSFYKSYLDKILSFNASKFSGTLSIKENTKEMLKEIGLIEVQILELKNKIKKEPNFSEKVNLNIELKKFKDKLSNLKSQI